MSKRKKKGHHSGSSRPGKSHDSSLGASNLSYLEHPLLRRLANSTLLVDGFVLVVVIVIAIYYRDKQEIVFSPEKSIPNTLFIASFVIKWTIGWAANRARHTEPIDVELLSALMTLNILAAIFLVSATVLDTLYIFGFPREIQDLLESSLPSLGTQISGQVSQMVTFLTSGVAGIITTLVLNVLSNYIYDKLKRDRSRKRG